MRGRWSWNGQDRQKGVGRALVSWWSGCLWVFLWFALIPAGAQDIIWRVRAHDSPMWSHPVEFSRDGTLLVSGAAGGTPGAGLDNSVKLWSTSSGLLVYQLTGNRGPAHGVSISPDNHYVASGSNWFHGQITIWNAQTGTFLRELGGHPLDTWDTKFSPDGVYLASCGGGSQVGIWRTSDWQNVAMREAPYGRVFCVTWSPDGQFVAAGSETGNVYIWQRETWALQRSWRAHSVVNYISFSENGEFIVTGSSEGTAKIWRLSDGVLLHTFSHSTGVGFAQLIASGTVIVIAGGNLIRFYSVTDGRLLAEWSLGAPIGGIDISHNEQFIAIGLNTSHGSDLTLVRNPFAASNRPPAVPTLIAPANNARVSPTPTFQLRASDPDGDRVRFEVQVWRENDNPLTFYVPASGYVASGQVASGTPPQPLPAGTWRWRARTWDERGAFSDWSAERVFVVSDIQPSPAPPTQRRTAEQEFLWNLVAPWRQDQYWTPSTYNGHAREGRLYAVDFNRASSSRSSCPYTGGWLQDCDEVLLASHAGRAYTRAQSNCEGYGNYVVVVSDVHPTNAGDNTYLATLYAHLNYFLVSNGTDVAAGQPIARLGSTGDSAGPHLHYEIREVTVSGSTLTLGARRQVLNNPAVRLSGQELRVDLNCSVSGLGYVGPPILGTASVEDIPDDIRPHCDPYSCGGFLWSPEFPPGHCLGELPDVIEINLADVNGDECVDDSDLLAVLVAFGGQGGPEDVNWDGVVDDADLLEVLFNFGSGC